MVSVNPLYQQIMDKSAARESGIDREKFDAVKFTKPGDMVDGLVLYVGDPYQSPNGFFEEGKSREDERFILTKKIILELDGGAKRALYINKDRMFEALGQACLAAEVYDVMVGHRLKFKFDNYGERPKKGSPPMLWKAKIVIP